MLRTTTLLLAALAATALPARADVPVSLRGSPSSMERQNRVAKAQDYTFLRTPAEVREFVEKEYLVPLEGNESYRVNDGVSFPYARPEMRTFVERLSAQYREGCGERLVVTSLTRPRGRQPGNAHPLSVHPAGMAVDLRISGKRACREWLEGTFLSLERKGILDATRERTPPHYHVALFPGEYAAYVERMRADSLTRVAEERARVVEEEPVAAAVQGAGVGAASFAPAREPAEGEGARLPLVAMVLAVIGLSVSLRRGRRTRR